MEYESCIYVEYIYMRMRGNGPIARFVGKIVLQEVQRELNCKIILLNTHCIAVYLSNKNEKSGG